MTDFSQPVGRQPRGAVKINGTVIPGWIDFDIDNNDYFSADTFRLKLAGGALPADMNVAWFSQQQDMYVELFIGTPADATNYSIADLKSWIYAQADEIEIDPVDNTITLNGRDLTRLFIDTKTTEKWPNLTSSQIATKLAQAHGLIPVVMATTAKAGTMYEIDHVNLTDDRSEWDLLNYLANIEGFVVFVRGQSLYFQPRPDPATAVPYPIVWSPATNNSTMRANFQRVKFRRALTVSRGIQVIIRSWNKKQARGFTAKYPSSIKTISPGKSTVGSGAQIYSKTVPNLDPEAATRYAQNWYQQLIAHEMRLDGLTMPGDNALDITSIIALSGTGTDFDQTYFPDSINRRMSFEGGYEMTICAKNHSPESQIGGAL